MSENNNINKKVIYAMATDPIYIGTGGYTIGRVDNTIVRDPITNIPKIPGSSLAGTWRYYVALELQSSFKDDYKKDLKKRAQELENFLQETNIKIEELKENKKVEEFMKRIIKGDEENNSINWITNFIGNRFARIKCAGQDDTSYLTLEQLGIDEEKKKIGHCGHCIVCKAFGFSKKDISNQGMLFFSDLNILFFPVFTRLGVKWITSSKLLNKEIIIKENTILTKKGDEKYLNLGWLNLEVSGNHNLNDTVVKKYNLKAEDIIIVPDSLISQIINSNLEVRTSVSIDPITGAAKEGALFTSEAIPRGTVFCGQVRALKREDDDSLPELKLVWDALEDSKKYFNSLGIGGMTTRGFGRLDILSELGAKNE